MNLKDFAIIIPLIILILCVIVLTAEGNLYLIGKGNYKKYLIRKIQRILQPIVAIFLWCFITQTISFYNHYGIGFSWITEYKITYGLAIITLIPILYILFYPPEKSDRKYTASVYQNKEYVGLVEVYTKLIPPDNPTDLSIMSYTINFRPNSNYSKRYNLFEFDFGYQENDYSYQVKQKLILFTWDFENKNNKKSVYNKKGIISMDSDTYRMVLSLKVQIHEKQINEL